MNPLNNLPGVGATAKDPARAKGPGMWSAAEAGLRRTAGQILARWRLRPPASGPPAPSGPGQPTRPPLPRPARDADGAFWQRRRVEAVPWLSAASAPTTAALRRRAGPPPAPPRSGAPASRIPHSMAS